MSKNKREGTWFPKGNSDGAPRWTNANGELQPHPDAVVDRSGGRSATQAQADACLGKMDDTRRAFEGVVNSGAISLIGDRVQVDRDGSTATLDPDDFTDPTAARPSMQMYSGTGERPARRRMPTSHPSTGILRPIARPLPPATEAFIEEALRTLEEG